MQSELNTPYDLNDVEIFVAFMVPAFLLPALKESFDGASEVTDLELSSHGFRGKRLT